MHLISTVTIETPGKRISVALPYPMSVWEVREFCRKRHDGLAPQVITLSGDEAIATYVGVKLNNVTEQSLHPAIARLLCA